MRNVYLILASILLLQLSCKKNKFKIEQTQEFINTKYKVYDSVIQVIDNMNGGVVLNENHYALNRDIYIGKNSMADQLVYNSDTFTMYKISPLTYSNKNGGFPLIGFYNDSLSIYRLLGGVGIQTWEYLQCVKY